MLATLFVLLSSSAPGHLPEDVDLGRAIDAWAAPLLEAGFLSGRLLVALGDDVLCERSFGLANRELSVPITADTRFCVASITKQLTIALTVRLIEAEKLGIDDPLERWLPGFPQGERITVDHLLNHRAGFPHRVTTSEQESFPLDAAQVAELARRAEPLFAPGERSEYSSAGYAVLARVCELAGGASYGELLRTWVLLPAGAVATGHADAREALLGRAASYCRLPGGYWNAPLKDLSFLVGAGSVWSTPRDLHRIQRAVLRGDLGTAVQASLNAARGFTWNGNTNGFRAFADYAPADGLHVIFTGNQLSGADDLLRLAVPRLAHGEELPPAKVPLVQVADVAPGMLARVQGFYRARPGQEISLRVAGPWVACGDRVLWPTSATTFFSPADFGTVSIQLGEKEPSGLEWVGAGFHLAYPYVGPLDSR